MRKGKTMLDATHEWVQSFGHFPLDMIEALYGADVDSWHEVTKPSVGSKVFVYTTQQAGEVAEVFKDGKYLVSTDDDKQLFLSGDDFCFEYDSCLPCWGTMWNFGDSADDYWLSDMGGLEKMSEIGLRVFEHDEWGYFFGIDGAGFDFFEAFWLPLYKARGLQWHDTDADKPEAPIKVTCYGKTEEWTSREDAQAFYIRCLQNSEGAERDRYLAIYLQLIDGEYVCSDEVA